MDVYIKIYQYALKNIVRGIEGTGFHCDAISAIGEYIVKLDAQEQITAIQAMAETDSDLMPIVEVFIDTSHMSVAEFLMDNFPLYMQECSDYLIEYDSDEESLVGDMKNIQLEKKARLSKLLKK